MYPRLSRRLSRVAKIVPNLMFQSVSTSNQLDIRTCHISIAWPVRCVSQFVSYMDLSIEMGYPQFNGLSFFPNQFPWWAAPNCLTNLNVSNVSEHHGIQYHGPSWKSGLKPQIQTSPSLQCRNALSDATSVYPKIGLPQKSKNYGILIK